MPKTGKLIDRAKARLKKMQERRGSGEYPFDFLALEDGSNIVRVMKSWNFDTDPDADFSLEIPYHRNVGPENKQVKCRGHIGKKCPICEEAKKLKEKAKALKSAGKQEQADKLYDKAKALFARSKYFMNAVKLSLDGPLSSVSGEEATRLEVLSVGPMVMEGILSQFVDDEADIGGKFWEEDSKYDFLIKKSGKELNTKYEVKPTKKYIEVDTSALEETPNNLDELFVDYPSYGEADAIMKGVEYEGDETDDDAEEEPEEKEEKEEENDVEEADDDIEVESPPHKAKPKVKPKKEEDEEEVEPAEEEEPEEAEEVEEEPEPVKKKVKAKAKPVEEEPEEEEKEDKEQAAKKKPVCFGSPEDHDPKDEMCQECPWFKKCATVVASKKGDDVAEDDDEPKAKPKKAAAVEKKLKKKASEDDEDVEF